MNQSFNPYIKIIKQLDDLVKSRFIEMFGSVKGNEKGLKKVVLKTVCSQIVDGSHNPSKGGNPSEYLMLSSKNVADGSITHDDPRYLSKEDFDLEDKRTKVRPGDILMTIVGTIGRTAIVPMNAGNLTFQRSVAVLHLDNQQVDPIFLKSCLDSIQTDIDAEAHGSSQKGIYLNQVEKIPVLVPDLPIQKEFSSFVQQVDKSKVIAQKAAEKYEQLVKSRFVEMFGDITINSKSFPTICFGDFTKQMNIGPFGSDLKNDCFVPENEGYCMVYEQKHAIDKDLKAEKRFVNKRKYEQMRRFDVGPGDILVSCRGTIGKCVLLPKDAEHGIIHPSLMMIRPKDDVNPAFLLMLLEKILETQNEKGSGVKMAIKATELSKIKTINPPKPLQDRFIEFVHEVNKSIIKPEYFQNTY